MSIMAVNVFKANSFNETRTSCAITRKATVENQTGSLRYYRVSSIAGARERSGIFARWGSPAWLLLITRLSFAGETRCRNARASLISRGWFSRNSTPNAGIAAPRFGSPSAPFFTSQLDGMLRVCARDTTHDGDGISTARPFLAKNRWRRRRTANSPIEREGAITRRYLAVVSACVHAWNARLNKEECYILASAGGLVYIRHGGRIAN